jgi:hypothetical protein
MLGMEESAIEEHLVAAYRTLGIKAVTATGLDTAYSIGQPQLKCSGSPRLEIVH